MTADKLKEAKRLERKHLKQLDEQGKKFLEFKSQLEGQVSQLKDDVVKRHASYKQTQTTLKSQNSEYKRENERLRLEVA